MRDSSGSSDMTGIAIRAMTPADIDFGMRLKEQAGWNQTEDDWRRLIEYDPRGVFVAELTGDSGPVGAGPRRQPCLSAGQAGAHKAGDGPHRQPRAQKAGTAATVRYGTRFGWIGMVLVSPGFRRRGIGTQLVNRCIEHLRECGVETIKLDATPAGRGVYRRLGFRDEWSLARFEGTAGEGEDRGDSPLHSSPSCPPVEGIEPMRGEDLDEVAAFDTPRFGADRSRLLADLFAAWPEACRVLRRGAGKGRGPITGFVMARRGARAHQVGPCVASAPADARGLLEASMAAMAGQKVYVDAVTENAWARPLVESLGLAEQRPFTRMASGPNRFPGDFSGTLSTAGPELG